MIKYKIYKILKKVIGGKGLTKYSSIKEFKQNIEDGANSEYVTIDGNKLYLDSSDSLRLSVKKEFEPQTTCLIQKNIFSGNIVVDIGANIGFFTLIMSNGVKKEG